MLMLMLAMHEISESLRNYAAIDLIRKFLSH